MARTNSPPASDLPPVAAIRCRGLRVAYPGFSLGPLDLVIAPGERIALLGANGSGKSTLLNAIAARIIDYEGSVQRCGRELRRDFTGARALTGILPERVVAYDWMTVADYLALHAEFFDSWDRALEDELVHQLKLDRAARIATLSKGTRVKVAFTAAEAHRPSLLVLDEPTAGLDPVMRDEVLSGIRRRLDGARHRGLIFSTHLLEDVVDIADRIVLLRKGRLCLDAPLSAIAGTQSPVARLREVLRHAR